MQLLHIRYLGATCAIAAALMMAGCGGGASPRPDNRGPFTLDRVITTGDFFDRNDDRYYDIFITEVTRSGRAQVAMSSFDLDSQVFIYRRDRDGEYDLVADDDDSGDGPDAIVNFDVRRGEVYRVIATSSREQEFGDYRIFFSRELGRPGELPSDTNNRTAEGKAKGIDLPEMKAKGAPQKRVAK